MFQIFVLTELYLFLSACYLLSDRQGVRILLLINLKTAIDGGKKGKLWILITGIVLVIGMCLLPMDPGPMFLGDFLPVFNIVVLLFYYVKRFSSPETRKLVNKKRDALGYATLAVALIHFLFPTAVIL